MKTIHNNQLNSVVFTHNDIDVSDSQVIVFKQLGSDTVKQYNVTINEIDCYAVTYDLDVPENHMPNAIYEVSVLDSKGSRLMTATVEVDLNNDDARAYIVE